jgi:hypothetical protein
MVGLRRGDHDKRAIREVLHDFETSQEDIDDWVKDRRGNDTAQICIVCETTLRFLWFSLREAYLEELRTSDSNISRSLAENWEDNLTRVIETGDRTLHIFFISLHSLTQCSARYQHPKVNTI